MDTVMEDTNHCSICKKEGKTTLATSWCEDCENCFCEDCLKLHDRVPLCINHTVSKLMGTQQKLIKRRFLCTEHDEKISLFCNDCRKVLCTICCNICHRNCEDVVTIKDMLSKVKDQLLTRQKKLVEKADTRQIEIVKFNDELDTLLVESAPVKTKITKAIQDAVDQLNEKETELLEKLDVKTDQQTEKLSSKIATKQTETQMYQQQSQFIQQALELEDEAQLFEMYLSSESEAEAGTEDDLMNVPSLGFMHDVEKLNEAIEAMDIRSVWNKININGSPSFCSTVDAKLKDDRCDVRDVVVMNTSDTKVTVFADHHKQRLKSFYQKKGQSCSSFLRLSGNPWCITVISEGKVAVSVQDKKHILTVAVAPNLGHLSTIPTSKDYWGLSSLDQSTLVVGSKLPPSVDLIDLKGIILKTFTTIPEIGFSFSNPDYIHVSKQDTILVSDWGLKSVICLTKSGEILFIYTPTGDKALQGPFGITTTSTGDILVADWCTHKVINLSNSGEFIRKMLTSENGLKNPFGLCVDDDNLCVTIATKGLQKYKFVSK